MFKHLRRGYFCSFLNDLVDPLIRCMFFKSGVEDIKWSTSAWGDPRGWNQTDGSAVKELFDQAGNGVRKRIREKSQSSWIGWDMVDLSTPYSASNITPDNNITPYIEFISVSNYGGGSNWKSCLISLPMPLNVQYQDQAQYGEVNLSAAEAQAISGNSAGGTIAGGLSGKAKDVLRSLFTTTGVTRAAGIKLGLQFNENITTEFKQMGTRRFAFAYKFMPRSAEEAQQIRNAQYAFQLRSYPTIETGLDFSVLKYPPKWKINFRNTEMPGIFETCYLETVSFSVNPSQHMWHPDGQPGEMDLQISFIEARALTGEDISDLQPGSEFPYELRPGSNKFTTKLPDSVPIPEV